MQALSLKRNSTGDRACESGIGVINYMNFDKIDENLEMMIWDITHIYCCIKTSKLCIGEMEAISKKLQQIIDLCRQLKGRGGFKINGLICYGGNRE